MKKTETKNMINFDREEVIKEIKALNDTNNYKLLLAKAQVHGESIDDLLIDYIIDSKLINKHKDKLIVLRDDVNITIIDSIMGSGKTSYIISQILADNGLSNTRYIVVVPTLDEVERYKNAINASNVIQIVEFEPQDPKSNYKGKLHSLQKLIVEGKNIITTHALIQQVDKETMEILKNSNYFLVIDEALDVVHQYGVDNREETSKRGKAFLTKSDIKTIFVEKLVTTDKNGFLIWNNEIHKDYNGRYDDIKRLCQLNSLMRTKKGERWSDEILMWLFPISFFGLFKKCYICTYMWEDSFQSAYFKLYDIPYKHKSIQNGELVDYNKENEKTLRIKYYNLINIHNSGLNEVGEPKNKKEKPLSRTWYNRKKKTNPNFIQQIKNNTYNFFHNMCEDNSSESCMWTIFKDMRGKKSVPSYKKSFVSCNAKATNEYRHKKNLAYLINCFQKPSLINFFENNGISVSQDMYALSELLQWIWRSRIRENKPINLYIPSKRMRELLIAWGKCEI